VKAFKICEVIKDVAYSMFNDYQHRLKYEIDTPTHPLAGWGPLSAFENIDQAIAFLEEFHNIKSLDFHLFECDCVLDDHWLNLTRELWCIDENSSLRRWRGPIPIGTILCKELTLLKEIPVKEVLYQDTSGTHWKLVVS